jgi:Xaa-Pro dipeptidase
VRKNLKFSENEYQQRVRKTQEMMDKRGMEMLLVMDPANMNYLTGYDGWSFYVHQGVIISLDAEFPLWFGREQDSNGARLTSWLPEDCIPSRWMVTGLMPGCTSPSRRSCPGPC